MECQICKETDKSLLPSPPAAASFNANHYTCAACLNRYVVHAIESGRTDIPCPAAPHFCNAIFTDEEIASIVNDAATCERYRLAKHSGGAARKPMNASRCPHAHQHYPGAGLRLGTLVRIGTKREWNRLTVVCTICERNGTEKEYCIMCDACVATAHGDTRSVSAHRCADTSLAATLAILKDPKLVTKPCPGCHRLLHKYEGCNSVQCTACTRPFCFACVKRHAFENGLAERCAAEPVPPRPFRETCPRVHRELIRCRDHVVFPMGQGVYDFLIWPLLVFPAQAVASIASYPVRACRRYRARSNRRLSSLRYGFDQLVMQHGVDVFSVDFAAVEAALRIYGVRSTSPDRVGAILGERAGILLPPQLPHGEVLVGGEARDEEEEENTAIVADPSLAIPRFSSTCYLWFGFHGGRHALRLHHHASNVVCPAYADSVERNTMFRFGYEELCGRRDIQDRVSALGQSEAEAFVHDFVEGTVRDFEARCIERRAVGGGGAGVGAAMLV